MSSSRKRGAKSDALKKSILQMAVEGKLTSGDTSEWVETTLGEVVQLYDKPKVQNGRYVRLDTHFLRGRAKVTYDEMGRFTGAGTLQILVDGENSGEVFKVPVEGYLGSTFKSLEIDDSCYEEYALLLIDSQRDNLKNNKRGAAIPHLDKKLFRETPLHLPPLSEQHAIVSKLEEILPLVERYSELERERDHLDVQLQPQLRRSILKSAINGELTIDPATGLPEDRTTWKETKLGEISTYGKSAKINAQKADSDMWCLELEDIEKESSKLLKKVRNSDRNAKSDKSLFQKNDVLYGKLRPYLDKVIIADENGMCSSEIVPIRPKDEYEFSPQFMLYFLKSPTFIDKVNALTYGVKMPRLGTSDAKDQPVYLPPLQTQSRIVAKIDQLFTQLDRLDTK
jgi:restriction endonuclease S subunit